MKTTKNLVRRAAIPLTTIASRIIETFDAADYFRGKKVVIIGPSCDSVAELIPRVEEADILAVVNKGHRTDTFMGLRRYARKSVMFHCLYPCEETGGGKFSSRELRKKGFDSIFFPLYGDEFQQDIEEFHRRNTFLLRLRRLNAESYSKLKSTINGYTPNTGFAAIWTIATGNCESLYISGINFMRSRYNPRYHNHLNDENDVIALIEKYGCHNPDYDLESFRDLVKKHNIQFDNTLTDILAKPTEYRFYQNR